MSFTPGWEAAALRPHGTVLAEMHVEPHDETSGPAARSLVHFTCFEPELLAPFIYLLLLGRSEVDSVQAADGETERLSQCLSAAQTVAPVTTKTPIRPPDFPSPGESLWVLPENSFALSTDAWEYRDWLAAQLPSSDVELVMDSSAQAPGSSRLLLNRLGCTHLGSPNLDDGPFAREFARHQTAIELMLSTDPRGLQVNMKCVEDSAETRALLRELRDASERRFGVTNTSQTQPDPSTPPESPAPPQTEDEPWERVPPGRDREMVRLWHAGLTNSEIARKLVALDHELLANETVTKKLSDLRGLFGHEVVPYAKERRGKAKPG